jgi:hypothetical protein
MSYEKTEITRPKGINKDLSPYELPPDTWSEGKDISFRRARTSKASGYGNVFYVNDTIGESVYHIYYTNNNRKYWVYASESQIYSTDGAFVEEIGSGSYTSDSDATWSGCNFNSIVVMNNRNDFPQVLEPTSGLMEDLPNWGDEGGIWGDASRCEMIRPYKNYLFALDNYDALNVRYPAMVRWSSPASQGDVPPSWDPFDIAEQAGLYELADTPGRIVEGKTLGDYFVIYKTDSVWLVQFVGGDFIMSFRKLFGDDAGCLSKDCVAEFDGKHFVMATNGAFVHNGATKTEVMEKWVHDEYFDSVDTDLMSNTKVVADHGNREIWVYFTTKDAPTKYADKALIWNWEFKEWTVKTLTNISHIAEGVIRVSDGSQSDPNVNEESINLLLSSALDKVFYAYEASANYGGTPVTGTVKRIGIDFNDDASFKEVTRITPHIVGDTPVLVSVFSEDTQTGNPTLAQTGLFDPKIEQYFDCHVVGRYIGVAFAAEDDWTLTGYTIWWKPLGDY